MDMTYSTHGKYRILVGKPEGKRPLGRPSQIEIGWGDTDWTDLAQDKGRWKDFVNMVINLRVPQNFGKFLSSNTPDWLSRRAQIHEVRYPAAETSLPI
jgi:hypothetical protein